MALDLEDKILLITGGTGSFGNGVPARLLETGIREIRIFSRDEKKQEDMRRMYRDRFPSSCKKLRFFLGDVREPDSLRAPMEGVNYVIHAAALKQVPSCEFFPTEAVRTNVLGTEHVLQAAVSAGAQAVVCLSTDKAAYPINAMGASKALMEKTAAAKAGTLLPLQTKICCTRCGNVLGTRGSVVPLFLRQIQAGGPLTLTEPGMTRFVMTMDEAIELVLHAVARAKPGDIWVRKAPACTTEHLARALLELLGKSNPVFVVGIRHGEKRNETLVTEEESARAEDLGTYFRIPRDDRDLYYEIPTVAPAGESAPAPSYHSRMARQLTIKQIQEKLLQVPAVRAAVGGGWT